MKDKVEVNISNDFIILSKEETKKSLDLHTESSPLENTKEAEKFPEMMINNSSETKCPFPETKNKNLSDSFTQTEEDIVKDIKASKNFSFLSKVILFLLFLMTQYFFILNFLPLSKNCVELTIHQPELSNRSELPVKDPESIIASCDSNQNMASSKTSSENHQKNTLKPQPIFEDIKFLHSEECEIFNGLSNYLEKLEYLERKINWKPSFQTENLNLNELFSYKNCEYFIGYSNQVVFKFTLYKDFTKSLNFGNIDNIVVSPNKEFLAVSQNSKKLSLIQINTFEAFSLDSKFKLFKSKTLITFAPDSSLLFYTRENDGTISAFSTLSHVLVQSFDTQNIKTVKMKASENLYHLIVRDEKRAVKIFSINSKNYVHLCLEQETIKTLEKNFPELENF